MEVRVDPMLFICDDISNDAASHSEPVDSRISPFSDCDEPNDRISSTVDCETHVDDESDTPADNSMSSIDESITSAKDLSTALECVPADSCSAIKKELPIWPTNEANLSENKDVLKT